MNEDWIFCKDKLPKENCTVLLTYKDFTGTHLALAEYKHNLRYFEITHDKHAYVSGKIYNAIAWMLAPKKCEIN
jgi:hypothetical protein